MICGRCGDGDMAYGHECAAPLPPVETASTSVRAGAESALAMLRDGYAATEVARAYGVGVDDVLVEVGRLLHRRAITAEARRAIRRARRIR